MIITRGQNVFAAEVENVILGRNSVADFAVIGLLDKTWEEAVTAVVAKKADAEVTEEELIALVKEKVVGFKPPKKIIFRDEMLLLTPTGKVTKFILVDDYSD